MSETRIVAVPDIGDFKDISIIEILVKPGDRVEKGAPLIVLESDKATLDVPSPQSGTVKELRIAIGDRVSGGSVLLTLDAILVEPPTAPRAAAAGPTAASRLPISEIGAATAALPLSKVSREPLDSNGFQRSPHASPSLRRIAREFGIDLSAVQGTGPRGRIVKSDLQQHVQRALAAPPRTDGGSNPEGFTVAPWPQIDFSKFGPIERAALSKIRKISATNLSRNSVVIPHVTNFEDADITDFDVFRQTLNAQSPASDSKLTILPFLIKAAAATLGKHAIFNCNSSTGAG
jgi:pyruvate dehydrogenase E2 component (dihydrolipoamide acetyltransferase)